MDARVEVGGLELWGGIECTVNRVGDRYFSQLDQRPYVGGEGDLHRFAELGIRALRYPVLWERVMTDGGSGADWAWSDAHLAALRQLPMRPIVGLVHHGSGPRDTSLVDPQFPEKLARYASMVARRYPWIEDYTPVNEPLTTARFSGLYGLWYPHGRDVVTFRKALFNQCRGIVLAMRAIERVNPAARLIQTDDLGTTYATPALQYQADFNNRLRWLGWDLVCGRVGQDHPLWPWLRNACQASEADIAWFAEHPRPPDVIGVNHYVTSDRFLNGNLEKYPASCHGGNGRERYADVEAARVIARPVGDVAPLLMEAWRRYGLPVAVTEAHIDARREGQMRWLAGLWTGADEARRAGADIQAVTAWSLLGSYDWNCLLTERQGYYETGAFDVRSGQPRATALTGLMRALASRETATHPALSGTGWWQRSQRFGGEAAASPAIGLPPLRVSSLPRLRADNERPSIVIIGANGMLGRTFARACAERDLHHRLLNRSELDIADADSVYAALVRFRPWAVINAAGYARVDEAERDPTRCFRENALGPEILARACAREGIELLTFSTHLVFDGERRSPYLESDAVSPLNVYGLSKARSETLVLDRYPGALVVRTSALFGPSYENSFVASALRALRAGQSFQAAHDVTISPTYVPDLVDTCLDLLIDREAGIWHITNGDAVTWSQLAVRAAARAGVDSKRLRDRAARRSGIAAVLPRYSALGSQRGFSMPSLDDALDRYLGA
ncbi:sugar nucleotide-binding protein [Luteibacter sp. 9133]|uniref:sugar nucleotide-binding protein n=1 Tax=Luteibacter sp. 9133 TaxID=1500891 RepID=UPI0005BA7816|nr:sugar nucleotide-binding protein [Luteibacter sp. 9133]